MEKHSFKEAARIVLSEADEPLHYREIARRIVERGLVETSGRTPEATVNAQLSSDISAKGEESLFVRTAPGVFGLREWIGRDGVREYAVPAPGAARLRIPRYPVLSKTARLLPVLSGVSRDDFLALKSEIYEQRGTPQDQVDWSSPDTWIEQRLSGRSAEIARAIWEGTGKTLNPRYLTDHWALIKHYGLMEVDDQGVLILTERGRDFIEDPRGRTVREIDVREGLDRVLRLVAELGPAARSDLLPPFGEFARKVSKLRADSSIKSFLWARLHNLLERGFVERKGRSYSITPAGLEWLAQLGDENAPETKRNDEILELVRRHRDEVRAQIAERLSRMDPYAFENLVKLLLEAMDYEDVEVTSKSGDGGVDVTARIQLGITEVREVVQVKRHAKNIQRSVLDALRGSLHRFGAVRGTIITTGGFARGTVEAAFEPGAAPITLIDGERLIELMLEHDIGVKKRPVELLELDPSVFEEPEEEAEEETGSELSD